MGKLRLRFKIRWSNVQLWWNMLVQLWLMCRIYLALDAAGRRRVASGVRPPEEHFELLERIRLFGVEPEEVPEIVRALELLWHLTHSGDVVTVAREDLLQALSHADGSWCGQPVAAWFIRLRLNERGVGAPKLMTTSVLVSRKDLGHALSEISKDWARGLSTPGWYVRLALLNVDDPGGLRDHRGSMVCEVDRLMDPEDS